MNLEVEITTENQRTREKEFLLMYLYSQEWLFLKSEATFRHLQISTTGEIVPGRENSSIYSIYLSFKLPNKLETQAGYFWL